MTIRHLDKDENSFSNGVASAEDKEVRAEILRITHPELGEVKGILTNGLSYKIYLCDSNFIQVDSEQMPGCIEYPDNYRVNDWIFDAEINVLEVTGYTSLMRLNTDKGKNSWKEKEQKYKYLLGIDYF